ncbi:PepSY-like domain-containing protein [Flavobacterium lindanitolerans]|nr:PepSY-like domain-containing protein [Flavobacterium lindanitolerans]
MMMVPFMTFILPMVLKSILIVMETGPMSTAIPAVPTAIVPEAITTYVTANYAGQTINTIEIERTGYDIELSNGLDLVFDSRGQFIRIDS